MNRGAQNPELEGIQAVEGVVEGVVEGLVTDGSGAET